MATNWSAYEACKEIYGTNRDNIAEIGNRYPLLARTVAMANSEYLLDILKALPKVTARVLETGLKEMEDDAEVVEEVPAKKEAATKAKAKNTTKSKAVEDEEEEDLDDVEDDYESMTAQALYKLCCKRGISSQCKQRNKAFLISVLKKNDGAGEVEDEWEDEEESEDPYEGKTAKELFKMCSDRGIKTKPKLTAAKYAELLKKADAESDSDDEEEDDDEWEV